MFSNVNVQKTKFYYSIGDKMAKIQNQELK